MNKTCEFIELSALAAAVVNEAPFPYLVIPSFIKQAHLDDLIDNFPVITHRGSFPVSSLACSPLFKRFIQELEGPTLKELISTKLNIPLQHNAVITTLRGQTTERDGKIHTDSKSKVVTLLLYMNKEWESEGGYLRLLNSNTSLEDYAVEITPFAGTCLIFKVTDNCWHGHKTFIGKRLSLQLNYLVDETAVKKQLTQHRTTAFLKRKLSWIFKPTETH